MDSIAFKGDIAESGLDRQGIGLPFHEPQSYTDLATYLLYTGLHEIVTKAKDCNAELPALW